MAIRMNKSIWVALAAISGSLSHAQTGVIRKIELSGNKIVSKEAILAKVHLKEQGVYNATVAQQDEQAINDMGLFQTAKITTKPLDNGDVEVRIEVIENQVVKEIEVTGNTVVSRKEILDAITITPGQILNYRNVRPSSDAITALYRKKGYFCAIDKFDFQQDTPQTFTVHVVEATINSITVDGNRKTKDKVMKRLIHSRPGDKFNETTWSQDIQRIYNTQWFEDVQAPPPDANADIGKLDLKIQVKDARTGNVQAGLTLDPRNSLAGTFRFADNNFNGTGQNYSVNYFQSPSGGGPSLELGYGNPYWDHRDTAFNFSIYSRILFRFAGSQFGGNSAPTTDNRYVERRTGLSFGFTRPQSATLSTSISTRLERVKTGDITATAGDFIKQDGDIMSIALGVVSNRRDVDLDPARGTYFSGSIEPGVNNITDVGGLSTTDILGHHTFVKGAFDFRYYTSKQAPRTWQNLSDPRRVLALRLRGGVVSGTVPFFEQYFAGGAESLRGYAEDRYWGKYSLLSTAEYRYPFVTKDGRASGFSLIPFVDYGGAWGGFGTLNTYTQSDNFNLHVGYGMGVAFKTPLGPIRLDYGINPSGGSRLHFLIATAF